MADKMLAGLYARISDDREGDALGVARQLKDGHALVAHRGGTIILECSDNDLSALKGGYRPGYEELMAAVDERRITHVVTWQTSRLWRNRRERAEGIERLARARVSVVAVKGPDFDMSTAYGRGMAGLVGEFDTLESEVKSERILRKVEELAEAGKIANGGPRPFGFRRIYAGEGPRRKILRDEIDPTEAEIVRECARRVLDGEPVRSVVRDLNTRGVRSSTGRAWSINAMKEMLRSGRIAGLRERRRVVVGKAVWPAIITREEHEQLRALFDMPGRGTKGSLVRIHYLTGFVYCLRCDRALVCGKSHGHGAYRCAASAEGGCGGAVVRRAELEDMVGLYMRGRLNDPHILRELAQREATEDIEAKRLVDQIEADERRLGKLRAALGGGDEDELPEVVATVREVRGRITAARRQLASRPGVPAVLREDLPDLAERWDDLDLDRKRALLAAFVEKITIARGYPGRKFDPDRVDIIPRRWAL
jgi:site-specific DNA recombinase